MYDLHGLDIVHGIDGTVGIALEILSHLQNTRTTKAFGRFGIRMFLPNLRQMQRITEGILHCFRHDGHQVFFAGCDPARGFGWAWYPGIIPI